MVDVRNKCGCASAVCLVEWDTRDDILRFDLGRSLLQFAWEFHYATEYIEISANYACVMEPPEDIVPF